MDKQNSCLPRHGFLAGTLPLTLLLGATACGNSFQAWKA